MTLRTTALLALLLAAPGMAQVPSSFKSLYALMGSQMHAFNGQLDGLGGGGDGPAPFAAGLPSANANDGPVLLKPTYLEGVNLELDAMQAMGLNAAMVEVGFPMLYQPFFSNASQYKALVQFYTSVAQAVRAHGMKLIVENDTLLSGGPLSHWPTQQFYKTLNWTQYQQARASGALAVAQTMQPDYLVVLQEPETEAAHTGQNAVLTPDGADSLLQAILGSVHQAGVPGMQVGAGVGTWLAGFDQFIQKFLAEPIDTLDIHIYPVNYNYLSNAISIAQMAAAAGKPLSMSESWLHKLRNSEVNKISPADLRARDTFSFWAPLDLAFIQSMNNLGKHFRTAYLTLFESEYLAVYLDYNRVKKLSPDKIYSLEVQAETQANHEARYSSTGLGLYSLLVPNPDHNPPTAPAELKASSSSHGRQVHLSWHASSDDVGVAGYYIYRNLGKIATIGVTYYIDETAAAGQRYAYTVEAFDLAGNVSNPTTVYINTK